VDISVFLSLVDSGKLITIIVLFMADWTAGILVAIFVTKDFQFSKIPNYLSSTILGMLGGYLLLGIAAVIEPNLGPVVVATFTAIVVGLLAMITIKLKKLGIPIPDLPWQKKEG